jgi:transposase
MNQDKVFASELREWRRLRALELWHLGWKQRVIAVALGVTEGAVSQWLAKARRDGTEALLSHWSPGRPAKLTAAQKRLIPDFLWHGAEAYGFRGDVWTTARVAKVLEGERRIHLEPLPSYAPS